MRSLLFLLLSLAGPLRAASAQEDWADRRLDVRNGLLVWLDAQAQPAAWQAHRSRGLPLTDGRPVDVWFDGSGRKRHLIQRVPDSQPAFRQIGDHSLLRFDGQEDFLASTAATAPVQDFSVVVFAGPKSNAGGFRALLGAAAYGQNDYTSGFNIDQSGFGSPAFQQLNVEGPGFGGARDLLAETFPFGAFHLIEVVASAESVRVVVDGQLPGQSRPRERQSLALDELVVGARLYSNEPQPVFVRGFLDGDIAELLLFDRALTDEELAKVRVYLFDKYRGINDSLASENLAGGHLLQPVEDPPPVQMLVPGFRVRQLPLDLPNINNVLYRADGTLIALGYNGNIYLLRDSDGDGLEDQADTFWENPGRLQAPIGMDLTPAGYKHGQGVFVASKGKCSLIVDTDGDDRADREIVLASGWPQLNHGVDALGVAFDRSDGSVYFGLGTANYANAYLPDPNGRSGYDLNGERGTIQRIAPDLKSREIACTGIRFPVALRFNAAGDLFCTDQEGATWLPNGNPFDELLHIQRGRHYGFPPRHPKFLPDVIDEPSTYDYGPQHQSACGLNFNEPVAGGRAFGPTAWRGDAIVTGYSRGKLYRTQLVKTQSGYVAQSHLLACLNTLTADACVSPSGDLVVAVHSGGPDWGSGPAGHGTLYRIEYADSETPQPVAVWPSNEREVRIAFDRPLDPQSLRGLGESLRIEHGAALAAGDRFESIRPGYAVVQAQLATRRFDVSVRGVQVTPDRRTIVVSTESQKSLEHYGVTLPDASVTARSGGNSALDQRLEVDLEYSLNGVAAELTDTDGRVLDETWLPHLDLTVAASFTRGSSQHEAFHNRQKTAAKLTLRTQLDLQNMLRAAVQPGSQLGFGYPPETVTLEFRSPQRLTVRSDALQIESGKSDPAVPAQEFVVRAVAMAPASELIPLEIVLSNTDSADEFALEVAWHTAEDDRERPVPLRRFCVPWARRAESSGQPSEDLAALPDELQGGSWGRGRKVFFGEKAQCSKCHRREGRGGTIGADLSNLVHRDYASVLRDIRQPSFAINPDHLAYSIILKDGRVVSGVVQRDGESLRVGNAKGELIEIKTADVDEMLPSAASIMPEGLDKQLGPDALRDLLTFLLTPPPGMPADLDGAPEPRSIAEVERVLAGSKKFTLPLRPLNILLVAGPKDHGPGEHDYPAWLTMWSQLLEAADNVTVSTALDWPSTDQFAVTDAIVFYQHGTFDDARAADLDAFLQRGGGVSYIHYAVDGGQQTAAFAKRIGLAWQGGQSRFRHGGLDLICDSSHAVTRNFDRIHFHDESYWQLTGDPGSIRVLATGLEDAVAQPLLWCSEPGDGRVFVSIPGHYSWTFDDPLFRVLLLRGLAWSVREPVDRFNDLVTPGARVTVGQEAGGRR